MLKGVDLSNLQGHPASWPNQPWYATYMAAEFVIIQGIEPPNGYPGANFTDPETGKRGYTGVQLRQAIKDGKKVGVYVWLWNGLKDTAADITNRLNTVPESVKLDMRPWVDCEDNTGHETPQQRLNDMNAARKAADAWAAAHGLPASGGYSGDWYVSQYLGGRWPTDWLKWWANYGKEPGSLISGNVVAHQFSSTPCDQSVMLESEIVMTTAERETPDDWAWPTWREAAINFQAIADQLGRDLADANAKIDAAKTALA